MTYFRYCLTLVLTITVTAAIAMLGTAWAQEGQASSANEIRIDVAAIHGSVDMARLPVSTVKESF
jgi:hypothetical protein